MSLSDNPENRVTRPRLYYLNIEPDRTPPGRLCMLCDSMAGCAHPRVKCAACGAEGLKENWPFKCCNVSERGAGMTKEKDPLPDLHQAMNALDACQEMLMKVGDGENKHSAEASQLFRQVGIFLAMLRERWGTE